MHFDYTAYQRENGWLAVQKLRADTERERLYRKTTRDNLDAEDEIEAKHAELIKAMRASIQHHFASETLFVVRWEVV